MTRYFASFQAWDQPGKVYQAVDPADIFSGTLADWPAFLTKLALWRTRFSNSSSAKAFGYFGYDGSIYFAAYPQVGLLDSHQDSPGWRDSIAKASTPSVGKIQSNWSKHGFMRAVVETREHILRGEVYQVNIAQHFSAPFLGDTLPIFSKLLEISPSPGAAYLDAGDTILLSASPELFLRIQGERIVTKPIKGTRRRGLNPAEDETLKQELQTDPKERAELTMITDLERNDLGRVCQYGSVTVPELLKLESYPQVHHLVSTVQGRLRQGLTPEEAFFQCFPGGSITGAPKKRAMEVIATLEPSPRGLYTGALGWFDLTERSAAFSIIIRTAVVDRLNQTITFGVGSGITLDSDPESEYQETLHKARGLITTLAGFGGL